MQELKSQFLLNPEITFLNFGSFGACPKPVFEDYQKWQLELETEPVQFIAKNSLTYLQQSREALGNYVGANADDLVFVTNPSYAVNIIAKSFSLKEGDEVLTTNLEYGACDKTWQYYCNKVRAKYIRQPVTLPLTTKEKFVEEFLAGLTSKTKLIFISHITSVTALRFPVEEICAIAKQKGILIFIDGAHAPGHIDLDLKNLDVDIYTGACHKWMMTAKGSSFLYVKKELQHLFDPLVVSWGYNSVMPSHSQFLDYHQMQGTRDISAFLTIPKAIQFMEENNWDAVRANCRKLVLQNAQRFCDILNTAPLCPIDDTFLVQMYSVKIRSSNPIQLQQILFEKYKIEIPIMTINEEYYIRFSINAFNTQDDLDKLYEALTEVL